MQSLLLNELLEEVLRLVRADLTGRVVTAICNLAPELPPATGDGVQLQQLALNLILNAAYSMATKASGTRRLHLTTTRHPHMVEHDMQVGLPQCSNVRIIIQLFSAALRGVGAQKVEVEVNAHGADKPIIVIVGLPDAAVRASGRSFMAGVPLGCRF